MTDTDVPYRDADHSPEERARDLLGRMLLDEKVAQLGSAWSYELMRGGVLDDAALERALGAGLGQITRLGGATSFAPHDSAAAANRIQRFLVERTRLGIPAIVHEECCSGLMARGATLFPQAIGVASAFDPELTRRMADAIRRQMRAVGSHQALSPVLDVTRDPRWGRVEETFGEDPYLVAAQGVAYVRGIQSDDLRSGVMATAKHFLGYGLPEGGMNWAPAHIPPRELLEVFAFPFEAAIAEADLASVMNAYHELDGVPCGASYELLTELLREGLGFDGVVVSDYFAVDMLMDYHQLTDDPLEAACEALRAGIDVELPSTDLYRHLVAAVRDERLDEEILDRAVLRHLVKKFELGLFDDPYVNEGAALRAFGTDAQRELAYELAASSIVLLRNEGPLLPLERGLDVAVVGPNAGGTRNLMGDYSYPAHVESLLEQRDQANVFDTPMPDDVESVDAVLAGESVLDAVRRAVGEEGRVRYAPGCAVTGDDRSGFDEAVAAAAAADVALLVVGGKSGLVDDCTTGEARDATDLGLPGVQEELVRAVRATGTPLVLVLVGGRPVTLGWMADELPAIVQAWLPGEEGAHALADVLFGAVNPAGRLPISIPRSVGQIPVYYNHKPSGGRSHWKGDYVDESSKPRYAFGHGLSYTRFTYDDFAIDRQEARAGERVEISVRVANVGERSGDEVMQLYTRDLLASVTQPVKALKGFVRVPLEPGESRRVTFSLAVDQLAFLDRRMRRVVEPGEIRVMIGAASDDIRVEGSFQIAGEMCEVHSPTFFSEVRVD